MLLPGRGGEDIRQEFCKICKGMGTVVGSSLVFRGLWIEESSVSNSGKFLKGDKNGNL